jgi:DNA-binding transcriptional LysR family regulator
MGPLNLRSVHYFIAVAEELHFGRAAARLNIGQPPLSQQIQRLEAELGVALFQRSKRKVEMTAAGRAFLDEARILMAQADRACDIARKAARGEIGQLAIGFVPSGNHELLTDILARFQRRYPDVTLGVQSLSTTAQLSALAEGRLQIGFVRLPVEPSGLEVRKVWSEPLVVAMSDKSPLARGAKLDLTAVAQHTLIVFPRTLAPGFYDVIMGLFLNARVRPVRIEEVEHLQTKLAMIGKGRGVAILPASVKDLRHSQVVYRPLTAPGAVAEIAVVYRAKPMSDVVKAFLELVEARPGRPSRARSA